MAQEQKPSFSGIEQTRRSSRSTQFVLIGAGLVILMLGAIGIRQFVGVEGAPPSTVAAPDIPLEPIQDTIEAEEWVPRGDSIAGQFLASRQAERSGDFSIAADLILKILEAQPDNVGLVMRAHLLLVGEGRFEEALPLAQQILDIRPDNPIANLTMAMQYVEDEAYGEALASILQIPHQGANSVLVPLLEAWVLAGMGETEAGLESFNALNRSSAFNTLKGLHAGALADMTGDLVRAESEYALALGDGEALPLRVAEIYVSFLSRQERWDEAEIFLEKYQAQSPASLLAEPMAQAIAARQPIDLLVPTIRAGIAESFYSIANLLNSGQPDIQPLIYVRHALRLDPTSARTLFLLGDILTVQERVDDAIVAFRQIDEASPFSWYARLTVASTIAEEEEGLEEAIQTLNAMVTERSDRPDAARTLGDVWRVEENWNQSVSAYDLAVERSEAIGDENWQLYYTRGIVLERRSVDKDLTADQRAEAWARSEADFLKALELSPDQPNVLNYLGYSWVEKGVRLDEAREMIERSVAQRPRDGYITDSMGWVLYRMEEFEAAVVLLERAVELEPSDPIINDHLGDAFWLVGRKNEARFQWNRALAAEPEDELAEDIRAKLAGEKVPQPKPPGDDSDI